MFEVIIDDEWVLKKIAYWANLSRVKTIAPGFSITWDDILSNKAVQTFMKSIRMGFDTFKPLHNKALELEKFVFMTHSRYRDHLSHSIRVAALGHFLLKQVLTFPSKQMRMSLNEYFCLNKLFTPEDFTKSWWIASLFHDICYPMAKFFSSTKTLIDEMNQTFSPLAIIPSDHLFKLGINKEETEDFVDILSNIIKDSVNTGVYQKFTNILEKTLNSENPDHGILGALILLMLTQGDHDEMLMEAAKAIALHNIDGIEIVLEEQPLPGFLALCDEIQDWGREIREINGGFHSRFKTRVLVSNMKLIVDDDKLIFHSTIEDGLNFKKTGFRFEEFQKGKIRKIGRIIRKESYASSFVIHYDVKGKSYQFSLSI